MACGECPFPCASRPLHRSRLISTNLYYMESIYQALTGRCCSLRLMVGCFRILRRAHALAACAYLLEARSTLDAMRRVRMRVFAALRARFKRSALAPSRVRMAFTVVWEATLDSETVCFWTKSECTVPLKYSI